MTGFDRKSELKKVQELTESIRRDADILREQMAKLERLEGDTLTAVGAARALPRFAGNQRRGAAETRRRAPKGCARMRQERPIGQG